MVLGVVEGGLRVVVEEQLRVLIARLREILAEHPRVADERVRFVEFGAYSLDLEDLARAHSRGSATTFETASPPLTYTRGLRIIEPPKAMTR